MTTYSDLNITPRTLMGPGPSDVAPRVLRALAHPPVGHLDPQFVKVMDEVQELLRFTEEDDFPTLIGSCVLHFGLIYLRPFTAGNGRLARLWQKRMLMQHWPVFGYLPVEAFIHRTRPAYHAALEYADRRGDCGEFISYLLERIDEALAELLSMPDPVRSPEDRMALFLENGPLRGSTDRRFRRKDYLDFYPSLSTATASRDLQEAVDRKLLAIEGTRRTALYRNIA